jgi:hypothetical protein
MNYPSQLTRLILSFYREEPSQLQELQILSTCKLSRRWGVMHIHCASREIAKSLIEAIDLLREPIAQLRLAQQIKITVNGNTFITFPVDPSTIKI